VGRPRKLSGNDLRMLFHLQGKGLMTYDPDEPIGWRFYRWEGLKLTGCFCGIDPRPAEPPISWEFRHWKKQQPTEDLWDSEPVSKRRPARSRSLPRGGLGNTARETDRIEAKRKKACTRLAFEVNVYIRLSEYKRAGKLSERLVRHDRRSACWDIWNKLKPPPGQEYGDGVSQRFEKRITEAWDLPPLK
jgi:hypothetical protein